VERRPSSGGTSPINGSYAGLTHKYVLSFFYHDYQRRKLKIRNK